MITTSSGELKLMASFRVFSLASKKIDDLMNYNGLNKLPGEGAGIFIG